MSWFPRMEVKAILPHGSMANCGSTGSGSHWVAARHKKETPHPPLGGHGFERLPIEAYKLQKVPALLSRVRELLVPLPLIGHLLDGSDKVK